MNGQTISWSATAPANTDLVGQGDDQIRSDKSALQTLLNDEHYFPVTGGANCGYHLLGSARPFQAAGSKISSTGTIGRLMVNTDDYSLWGDSGSAAVPLGHQNLIFNGNASGGAYQRSGGAGTKTSNCVQYGQATIAGSQSSIGVTFASAYSGLPIVFVTSTTGSVPALIYVVGGSASKLSVWRYDPTTAALSTSAIGSTFNWMSIGTIAAGVP